MVCEMGLETPLFRSDPSSGYVISEMPFWHKLQLQLRNAKCKMGNSEFTFKCLTWKSGPFITSVYSISNKLVKYYVIQLQRGGWEWKLQSRHSVSINCQVAAFDMTTIKPREPGWHSNYDKLKPGKLSATLAGFSQATATATPKPPNAPLSCSKSSPQVGSSKC